MGGYWKGLLMSGLAGMEFAIFAHWAAPVLFCSASADAQNRAGETVLPPHRGSILGRGRPPRPFSFPLSSDIFSPKVDANRKRERKQADRLCRSTSVSGIEIPVNDVGSPGITRIIFSAEGILEPGGSR